MAKIKVLIEGYAKETENGNGQFERSKRCDQLLDQINSKAKGLGYKISPLLFLLN